MYDKIEEGVCIHAPFLAAWSSEEPWIEQNFDTVLEDNLTEILNVPGSKFDKLLEAYNSAGIDVSQLDDYCHSSDGVIPG